MSSNKLTNLSCLPQVGQLPAQVGLALLQHIHDIDPLVHLHAQTLAVILKLVGCFLKVGRELPSLRLVCRARSTNE